MLDAARNIGNAALGEGLRCLDLMRESKAYQAAKCRQGQRAPQNASPGQPSSRLFEAFGVSGHNLQKFAKECRDNCWIKDHLAGHCAQTAATRALSAIRVPESGAVGTE
jgi:putative transposase